LIRWREIDRVLMGRFSGLRDWGPHRVQLPAEQAFAAVHAEPSTPPIPYGGGISRRALLAGAAGALAEVALSLMSPSANAQVTGQTPALGRQILGPVLSQPGWSKWIGLGQIAPLYEGEIALLSAIEAIPAFGAIAEARARQFAADVRTMRPDAKPAYVAAFLAFAGLQNTTVFRQWHQASYEKYAGHSEYPSGDDPYIWGRDRIAASAALANVEIGYVVERLELSGVPIQSFSKESGARTSSSVLEDYLFEHYRLVAARLDGNESKPAEGSRLAKLMFARKDITGLLNVVSRGYTHPSENALLYSAVANKDISLCSYVTDFAPDYKVLLYGIGKELDAWIEKNYPDRGINWGLMSGVRPLSRTSVRLGNLASNPRNSTHGRGVAADIILAGPGAYQLVEAGRKAWSEALWGTALSGISAKYGLRHLGPSLNDWPHIDIDPREGFRSGAIAQLDRWRQVIAQEAGERPNTQRLPKLIQEPQELSRRPKQ
jgi:hypothetical protein